MKLIPNSITRTVARQNLVLQKHSPTILFAAGLVGVVGSTVLACRATLKLGPVLDDFKHDIDAVKNDLRPDVVRHPSYTSTDHRKDLAYVYLRDTARIAQLYAPAIIVGAASIGALTGSHVTLQRRNANLTAAVVTLTQAYAEYRDRVREEVGEEREYELHHGITREKVKTADGKTITRSLDPNNHSVYARLFDELNIHWQKSPEYNRLFLTAQQNYFNNLLQARGHVFLNEVYDALGLDHSGAGAVVGWVIGHDGDNYIDFGILRDESTRFINGWEPSILLDFNVDGVIYDKI